MLTMLFTARRWPRLPGAIVGVVIGALTYYALLRYWPTSILGMLDLGPVVGAIPPKFPAPVYLGQFVAAAFDPDTPRALWSMAPSIAVLAILGAPAGGEIEGTGASVKSRRLVTLSPGVMFGEMVLVENQPRSADAVVEQYAVVYSLSRAALESLRVNHPSLSSKLLLNMSRLLADRLRTTTEELRAAAS